MYPSIEDKQLSYDTFMHSADASESPYFTSLQPTLFDRPSVYLDRTPVNDDDVPLEPPVCVAAAFSQYNKMVDAHRNANIDSWTHTPTAGLAPLDLWRSTAYEQDLSSALPNAVYVNRLFFAVSILTARRPSRSPELLSPGDPTFMDIYRGPMQPALDQSWGPSFPSPQFSDISLYPASTSTSPSTSSSELDSIVPPPPPPLHDPRYTTSPDAFFAPLPPASDSASPSSASDMDSGESLAGVEEPYSLQISRVPLPSSWATSSDSEYYCPSTPSAGASGPARQAARTASSVGRRKRSTALSPSQRKSKIFRTKSSVLDAVSSSSSSSRHTSPSTSSTTERFFPEVNCTLRVVPGKVVHTKSRTLQKDVDYRNPESNFTGNQCNVCRTRIGRRQDRDRHLRLHGQTEFICCDGVPLGEAAEHGIILHDHDVVNSWPHTDQLTVGGCGKVLARSDALSRHFLKYPACKQREVSAKKVNHSRSPSK